MRIVVAKIISSPRCITKEDGIKIYNLIHDLLLNKTSVVLDFDGISQFASPFFNFAIGQLLKDIDKKVLTKLLVFDNLGANGKEVVDKVIENAVRFHTQTEMRNIINEILGKNIED